MFDSNSTLLSLQRLQFADRAAAESELLAFMQKSGVADVTAVRINVKPESLNSLNGIATFQNGNELFFKAHTEENEQLDAYYEGDILAKAGYPLVRPNKVRTMPGEQMAFYEVVHFPTLFDLAKEEEDSLLAGNPLSERGAKLISAEQRLNERLLKIYRDTLLPIDSFPNKHAAINQLFSSRLAEDGRIDLFYRDKELPLKQGVVKVSDLFGFPWTVNGVTYKQRIGELIARGRELLDPSLACATIVGHGDAHNGNVFWNEESEELLYFDPAFAGRHSPLLDLTKPLFHNSFARWMYFPDQVSTEFDLSYKITGNQIEIEHNFKPSFIREQFLQAKCELLVKPILRDLISARLLNPGWNEYLRSALFCCPLLAVNLAASFNPKGKLAERYPEIIQLLGFSIAVEVAADPLNGSSVFNINNYL